MLGLLRALVGAVAAKLRPDPAAAYDTLPQTADHSTPASVRAGDVIVLANGEVWEVDRGAQ